MKKNKEQKAFEEGIEITVKALESYFAERSDYSEKMSNSKTFKMMSKDQEKLLSDLRSLKNIDYPIICGTCGSKLSL